MEYGSDVCIYYDITSFSESSMKFTYFIQKLQNVIVRWPYVGV